MIIYNDFIRYLKSEGLLFLELTNITDISGFDNDIDLVIDHPCLEQVVRNFATKNELKLVTIWKHSRYGANYFLLGCGCCLNLDIYTALVVDEREIVDRSKVFTLDRDIQQQVIELYHYLKAAKKGLFLPVDPVVISDELVSICTWINNRRCSITDLYAQFRGGVRKSLIFKNLFRIIQRILRPNGLVVAFLGPDGSGKSTVMELISNERVPFRRKICYHLYPSHSRLIDFDDKSPMQVPYTASCYGHLKSTVKLFYLLCKTWFYWVITIPKIRRSSSLVILDRYMSEIEVDPRRFLLKNMKFIPSFVRLFPKPDLSIFFDGSGQVFFQRKGESSSDEIDSVLAAYRRVAKVRNWRVVNANLLVDDVASLVEEKINYIYGEKHI